MSAAASLQTGLKVSPLVNLSSAELIERAVKRAEGVLDKNGALVVETGARTGRSPNDRFIVKEPSTEQDIDWGKVNKPFDADKFDVLWKRVEDYLNTQEYFLWGGADRFCLNSTHSSVGFGRPKVLQIECTVRKSTK